MFKRRAYKKKQVATKRKFIPRAKTSDVNKMVVALAKRGITAKKPKVAFDLADWSGTPATTAITDDAGTTVLGQPLIQIGQGTTDETRVGDSIRIKSIHLKMAMTGKQAGTLLRVLVVQHNEALRTNLGQPPTNLLEYPGAGLAVGSHLNFDYFRGLGPTANAVCLYDKTFTLQDEGAAGVTADTCSRFVETWINPAWREVNYAYDTTPQEYSTHNVYIYAISNKPAGATVPHLQYWSRVVYTD